MAEGVFNLASGSLFLDRKVSRIPPLLYTRFYDASLTENNQDIKIL
jgi:hypothetical protein